MMATKKASRKKSLTKTQFQDEVRNYLLDEYGYEEDEISRKDVANIIEATVDTAIEHSPEGLTIPGLGKIILYFKKPQKARMGVNPSTGEKIKIKKKPAAWVPKFRLVKASKDGCLSYAPKIKKKKKK